MDRLALEIRKLGGFGKAAELYASGYSPAYIRAAVTDDRILRVRKGWYAGTEVAPDAIRAFRVGGKLTCLSGAVHYGLWVPEHSGLHVAVPRRASRLRTADDFRQRLVHGEDSRDVVVHWGRMDFGGNRQVVTVIECILQVFACQGSAAGFVVLESALRKRLLHSSARDFVLSTLPVEHALVARHSTADSDSGTESIVKLGLILLGIRFVQQAVVDGVGPLDFLIGDRLVVEIDSREFHSDPYRDRHKDALLSIRGCRVLRFMYSQVVYEWPSVERSIVAALSRGDHQSS